MKILLSLLITFAASSSFSQINSNPIFELSSSEAVQLLLKSNKKENTQPIYTCKITANIKGDEQASLVMAKDFFFGRGVTVCFKTTNPSKILVKKNIFLHLAAPLNQVYSQEDIVKVSMFIFGVKKISQAYGTYNFTQTYAEFMSNDDFVLKSQFKHQSKNFYIYSDFKLPISLSPSFSETLKTSNLTILEDILAPQKDEKNNG